MRIALCQVILFISCLSMQAQKVSNIRAEQRGQDIVVLYSLETTSPCEVSVLLSQDNGATWGSPLKNVSGDVGKNISAGEKQITWKVLEEQEYFVGDKVNFKVIANSKKYFEPEMVFVEGGKFEMGSNLGDVDEKPVHEVILSSFNIGKYELTQSQWMAVMGNNPSYFTGCENCPVENVSWNDVEVFIKELNLLTGKKYRLPTEAEWEYAAKGGSKTNGFKYSGSNEINMVGWYSGNSGNKSHTVGGKLSNELGIFDLTGNVNEWCQDWYSNYVNYSENNPSRLILGQYRILRGGDWDYSSNFCLNYTRRRNPPEDVRAYIGFRLVLPVE